VAADEQVRFERTLEQVERFVDDQLLVLRRRREELDERLRHARTRRDAALGAEARSQAEAELGRLQAELDEADSEIARLAARRDPEYEKWRDHAHRRRYLAPSAERILDVEFVLG
jgi:ABC-type phosphate transport system auxiliary subunit